MSDNKTNPEKIWEKGIPVDELIEKFTIGKDRELDVFLAPYDVLGSLAHVKMLHSIGLIKNEDLPLLEAELVNIYQKIQNENFEIEEGIEDVHSQVELMLTRKLGEAGKKIHSGRSRNDQVLLDLKLFTRNEIQELTKLTSKLFDVLIKRSENGKDVLIPGYTHLQVAMPSSFGLWFGAYAESLTDDLLLLNSAWKITNQNPLGSAAGYGSSFPLDRQMTTDLLGFNNMNYNVVYAQMGRGKVEKTVAFGMSSIAATLSKLAFDVCLFTSQNFGFITLPDNMTTGSSIMPHKKNPDVFELLRAHCNKLQSLPNEITLMINNLPSGYFRDLQIIKEVFIPAFEELKNCLKIATYAIENMKINSKILDDKKYDLIFSVEEVNKLVNEGMPFRDAYKHVAQKIMDKNFVPMKKVKHTHQGSIGNLCNDQIELKMQNVLSEFNFSLVESAISDLLKLS
ncbi:MAG: argininosuccinate lyase [Prolixibacteraceae bacterium]|jgi:argininosuccinate lyase|nr:argininosuccinate lyase [Prolixibacteraceae bacterium]